jgi:hypothetical protein
MNPEIDAKLVADFPLLYKDRHASITLTSMCYGFDCGDGWASIIRDLSSQLEAEIKGLPVHEQRLCRAAQVKKQFGKLRFYMAASTRFMERLISRAEAQSGNTCELCGDTGRLRHSHRTHELKTLCRKCATEQHGYKIVTVKGKPNAS